MSEQESSLVGFFQRAKRKKTKCNPREKKQVYLAFSEVPRTFKLRSRLKLVHHVETEDRTVNKSFTVKGTQAILINESGLYALILGSKLESVKCQILWVEICEFGKIKMQ